MKYNALMDLYLDNFIRNTTFIIILKFLLVGDGLLKEHG